MQALAQSSRPVAEKVDALSKYLEQTFGYGKGLRAALRIALAPGTKALEKIAAAREGNCYDVNRLAYVLLAKVGVAVEMHTGFSPGAYHPPGIWAQWGINKNPQDRGFGEIQREPVAVFADIGAEHAHAFLRYFDPERQVMVVKDFTPQKSLADRREFLKDETHRETTRQQLEAQYGLPLLAAVRREDKVLNEAMSRIVAWFGQEQNKSKEYYVLDSANGKVVRETRRRYPLAFPISREDPRAVNKVADMLPVVWDFSFDTPEQTAQFLDQHARRAAFYPLAREFYKSGEAEMQKVYSEVKQAAQTLLDKLGRSRKEGIAKQLQQEDFFDPEEEFLRSQSERFTVNAEVLSRYLMARYIPDLCGPYGDYAPEQKKFVAWPGQLKQGVWSYPSQPENFSAPEFMVVLTQTKEAWRGETKKRVQLMEEICRVAPDLPAFNPLDVLDDQLCQRLFDAPVYRESISKLERRVIATLQYVFGQGRGKFPPNLIGKAPAESLIAEYILAFVWPEEKEKKESWDEERKTFHRGYRPEKNNKES